MNIRVEPTTDISLIKSTMANPAIFNAIRDDGCSSPEDLNPVIGPACIYLACWDDDVYLGLFLFVKSNFIMWEAHNCMLPPARGQRCRDAGKMAIQWMWDNTSAEKIFGYTPADNPAANKFALDVGAEVFGVNKKALKRDGKLIDLIYYGISKE